MYFIQILGDGNCYGKGESINLLEGQLEVTKEQYDAIELPVHCVIRDKQLIDFSHFDPPVTPTPPPTPTADEDRDALLVDLDYRITLLELGVI